MAMEYLPEPCSFPKSVQSRPGISLLRRTGGGDELRMEYQAAGVVSA